MPKKNCFGVTPKSKILVIGGGLLFIVIIVIIFTSSSIPSAAQITAGPSAAINITPGYIKRTMTSAVGGTIIAPNLIDGLTIVNQVRAKLKKSYNVITITSDGEFFLYSVHNINDLTKYHFTPSVSKNVESYTLDTDGNLVKTFDGQLNKFYPIFATQSNVVKYKDLSNISSVKTYLDNLKYNVIEYGQYAGVGFVSLFNISDIPHISPVPSYKISDTMFNLSGKGKVNTTKGILITGF